MISPGNGCRDVSARTWDTHYGFLQNASKGLNELRKTVTAVPTVELSDQPSPMVIAKPRHRHFHAELSRFGGIGRRAKKEANRDSRTFLLDTERHSDQRQGSYGLTASITQVDAVTAGIRMDRSTRS